MDNFDPSLRPYMLRAWHEWCTDQGHTPHLVVQVDAGVQVPREFVQDGQIVLNTSYTATSQLQLANDYVSFTARFGGKAREIIIPVSHVVAIYARETGQGMAFPAPVDATGEATDSPTADASPDASAPSPATPATADADGAQKSKPSGIKRVK